jgi:hypothetical protein
MDKNRILLKDIDKVNPFKVPEGYFENFTNGIMSQLPIIVQEKAIRVNLWHRARPWVYMAAMLTGVALMIRVFVGSPTQSSIKTYSSGGLNLTSSADIEDFYNYYEEGLARTAYNEAFYSEDFSEDIDWE